jgi:hypothetical protein
VGVPGDRDPHLRNGHNRRMAIARSGHPQPHRPRKQLRRPADEATLLLRCASCHDIHAGGGLSKNCRCSHACPFRWKGQSGHLDARGTARSRCGYNNHIMRDVARGGSLRPCIAANGPKYGGGANNNQSHRNLPGFLDERLSRPGLQKNASVRISMLSRGSALGGEVGSRKAVWAVHRAEPSRSES